MRAAAVDMATGAALMLLALIGLATVYQPATPDYVAMTLQHEGGHLVHYVATHERCRQLKTDVARHGNDVITTTPWAEMRVTTVWCGDYRP